MKANLFLQVEGTKVRSGSPLCGLTLTTGNSIQSLVYYIGTDNQIHQVSCTWKMSGQTPNSSTGWIVTAISGTNVPLNSNALAACLVLGAPVAGSSDAPCVFYIDSASFICSAIWSPSRNTWTVKTITDFNNHPLQADPGSPLAASGGIQYSVAWVRSTFVCEFVDNMAAKNSNPLRSYQVMAGSPMCYIGGNIFYLNVFGYPSVINNQSLSTMVGNYSGDEQPGSNGSSFCGIELTNGNMFLYFLSPSNVLTQLYGQKGASFSSWVLTAMS